MAAGKRQRETWSSALFIDSIPSSLPHQGERTSALKPCVDRTHAPLPSSPPGPARARRRVFPSRTAAQPRLPGCLDAHGARVHGDEEHGGCNRCGADAAIGVGWALDTPLLLLTLPHPALPPPTLPHPTLPPPISPSESYRRAVDLSPHDFRAWCVWVWMWGGIGQRCLATDDKRLSRAPSCPACLAGQFFPPVADLPPHSSHSPPLPSLSLPPCVQVWSGPGLRAAQDALLRRLLLQVVEGSEEGRGRKGHQPRGTKGGSQDHSYV